MTETSALPVDFSHYPGLTEDERLECTRYWNTVAGIPDCFDLGRISIAGAFDDDQSMGPSAADYADFARAHLEMYEQWRDALFGMRGAFYGIRVSEDFVLYGRLQYDELRRAAHALGSYALEALCGKPMHSPQVGEY